ncbi:MAG: hypothetical protein LBU89_10070 [Fibromonadaceae bacterium]|jgi:hypothetical protein|nr:hypothetical protein [Fibromonadaceae bacterium]
MFKRTLKVFGPALGALSLAIAVVILGACGSGNPSKPSDSDSSSSSYSSQADIEDPDFIKESTISAQVEGPAHENLLTTIFVEANYPHVLDKIIITVNGTEVDRPDVTSGSRTYSSGPNRLSHTFTGKEHCGDTFQVCMQVYAADEPEPKAIKCASPDPRRQVSSCDPESLISSSSSAAVVRTFQAITFGGNTEITLNSVVFASGAPTIPTGVALSTGTGENNINLADIYYDGPAAGPGSIKTVKSNVKIITEFQQSGGGGNFYWDTIDDPAGGIISNPQSTSQFPLRPLAPNSDNVAFAGYQYYMIRTSATPNEWTTNDYLVLTNVDSPTDIMSPRHKTIKIKAWKVSN